jgi:hypothetical protein
MKNEMNQLINNWENIDRTQFKDVPKDQQLLFFDFHKDHPYSTISFQSKEFKYLSSGQGRNTLVFLHGALVRPDMWFYSISKMEKDFQIIAPLFLLREWVYNRQQILFMLFLNMNEFQKSF